MTLPVLPNPAARRIFLHLHALAEPPTGPGKGADLAALVDRIGFVQLDSINTVARAHHMILFARRQSYRPEALSRLVEKDRVLWEHWTHDASVIPTEHFAHWRHRFRHHEETRGDRWRAWLGSDAHEGKLDEILNRIARDGPVSVSEVGEDEARSKGGWWEWHPSKAALEWLWHTGRLSVTRRDAFRKVYDLTERVIPPECFARETFPEQTRDWACNSALDRLGFATSGEIAAFWAAIPPAEAKDWCTAALARGEIEEVLVQGHDGALRRCFARPGLLEQAMAVPEPPARIRILSPFDPALRDRARAERLFGFHYRIEVFVPEPKRTYGYYVFPMLEGARIVGRIDMKRAGDTLAVRAFWPEAGVRLTAGRMARLEAELERMARFTGCERVSFAGGWQRETLARD
ncbi:MAG: crosslink repair DNA glycosylase YcaQ family protein [Paracoccaceae bacterium]